MAPHHPTASTSHLPHTSSGSSPNLTKARLMAQGLPDPDQLPHLKVGELTYQLGDCIKHHFSNLNVRGEVGSLKRGRGGHVFLTLKEGDASIDAVVWASDVGGLSFFPKVGDEVMVNGDLKVRPKSGVTSFQIRHLMPTGEGLMQAEFERIYDEFESRGLFNRALRLPKLPQCVGLITSYQTSAYHDFYKTHRERAPGIKIIFEDAVMQGPESCISVSNALRKFYANPEVDVIALTRGGGSMEHLWGFNHPDLCYLITQSPKPIVVGIGHEDNTLLAELVADVRGYTPTGVASAIFPRVIDLKRELNSLNDRLEHVLSMVGGRCEQRLQNLSLALAPLCSTDPLKQMLDQRQFALERVIDERLVGARIRVDRLGERLHYEAPQVRIERADHQISRLIDELLRIQPTERFDEHQKLLVESLDTQMNHLLEHSHRKLMTLAQQLEVLSPLKTLARGYSLVRDETGSAVTDAREVKLGDTLKITLRSGELKAEVCSIHPHLEIIEPTEDQKLEL